MSAADPTPAPWGPDFDIYAREADYRLAMASPELLAALVEARDVLAVALAWPNSEATRSKINVAISKATGGAA